MFLLKVRKVFLHIILIITISVPLSAQLILADTNLVCKDSPLKLYINPTIFNDLDFCVKAAGERDGLYYFTSCNRISFDDAYAYAKLMKGNLATGNTQDKNRFISNILPNNIKWMGYSQNPNSEKFNDPPDPSSGFEWMSGADVGFTAWANEEPNNREDENPGMNVIQGCSNGNLAEWCDVDKNDGHKYIAVVETKFNTPPNIPDIKVRWETQENSRSIIIKPSISRYYRVSVYIDGIEIKDSILINVAEVNVDLSLPGGCGDPFVWTPEIITKIPVKDLEIDWFIGENRVLNQLNPQLNTNKEGLTPAGVTVKSKSCNAMLAQDSITFNLAYPFVETSEKDYEAKLNEIVKLDPINSNDKFLYSWSPINGLSDPSIAKPSFMAEVPITYSVKINDGFDCIIEEVFNFTIDPRINIYIPNSFSPNADSWNDELIILTNTGFYGQLRSFIIYDRLGQMVYQTNDTWSWNGIYKNEVLPRGQYIYTLQYEIENITYSKKGEIWLLK